MWFLTLHFGIYLFYRITIINGVVIVGDARKMFLYIYMNVRFFKTCDWHYKLPYDRSYPSQISADVSNVYIMLVYW